MYCPDVSANSSMRARGCVVVALIALPFLLSSFAIAQDIKTVSKTVHFTKRWEAKKPCPEQGFDNVLAAYCGGSTGIDLCIEADVGRYFDPETMQIDPANLKCVHADLDQKRTTKRRVCYFISAEVQKGGPTCDLDGITLSADEGAPK